MLSRDADLLEVDSRKRDLFFETRTLVGEGPHLLRYGCLVIPLPASHADEGGYIIDDDEALARPIVFTDALTMEPPSSAKIAAIAFHVIPPQRRRP
jgi:hypothetical protein